MDVRRQNSFTVRHFAGPVSYCGDRFVSKNKDDLEKRKMTYIRRELPSLELKNIETPWKPKKQEDNVNMLQEMRKMKRMIQICHD